MELHLMRPEWLWLLAPAAVLALMMALQHGRSGNWRDVIAPELLQHLVGEDTDSRRNTLLPVIVLAWVLAALAASGPSWKQLPQPVLQKQDALVLVLDLSYSMKSADLAPSRLDRARQKLLDLLEQRREGQTGLIAYAGDSHIVTPLTDDTPTIANLLPALHPDMMPVAGSNAAAAVEQAIALLDSAGIRQGRILLLTDDIPEPQHEAVKELLQETGIELSLLGIGTATGAPVPLARGGFLKDREGTIVMPSLNEGALNKLASAVDGRYRSMQIDDSDLDYLLADIALPGLEQTLALDRTADTWEDQGYFLVLVLLVVALGLFRRGWLLTLLPVLFISIPEPAQALEWQDLWLTPDQKGHRALASGDHESASSLFEDKGWAGTAAYRGGDYDTALKNFSGDDSDDGWYNRGNALARAGKLDEAIEAYEQSLVLNPDQQDAEENIALLEQLKQQQQEQQQQNDQQDESQNDEQDSEQNQDQQNQSQSEDDQNQDQQDQQQSDSEQQQKAENSEENQPPQDNEQQPQDSPGEDSEQEEEREQPAQPEQSEGAPENESQLAAMPESPEDAERDQAMEQWLRRVPDDPSGLLREKFRYESKQRQQQGNGKTDEIYW